MRRLINSALPALVALAVLSGCSAFGPDASHVVFETAAAEYAPGAEVSARLANDSDGDVGYNLCFTTVEAKADGWEPIDRPDEEARFCQAILLGLEPGGVAETTVALPADLAAGEYRLVTEVELEDDRRVEVTAPFEVR